jgi:hypothetical protein
MTTLMTKILTWTRGLVCGLLSPRLPVLELDDPCRELRATLLGRHRRQIAVALGRPPTASVSFGAPPAASFWQAGTWYYPFDRGQRKAIAIRFVGDRAREIEFIGAP